jgi:hypothetical protein
METYELLDEDGRMFAFEVNNAGLGRKGVCRIVETIPGAQITRRPKFLSWFREEVFCEFSVGGKTFVAWEPFGDNSRYWIGPEPTEWLTQTQSVRDAFESHKESRFFRRVGFVVGAFMVAVGLMMFADAEGGSETISAITGIALGAYFINFAITGQRSFWAHRRRK